MDVKIKIEIWTQWKYAQQAEMLYEEEVEIQFNYKVYDRQSDMHVLLKTKIVMALKDIMLKYKNMTAFYIVFRCNYDTVHNNVKHEQRSMIFRVDNNKRISYSMDELTNICTFIYRDMARTINTTMKEYKDCLIDNNDVVRVTHGHYNIFKNRFITR